MSAPAWCGLSWDRPMAVGVQMLPDPGDECLDPVPVAVQPVVVVLHIPSFDTWYNVSCIVYASEKIDVPACGSGTHGALQQ